MNLQTFLELHLKGMQDCFNLKHYELTIVYKKNLQATYDIDVDTTYLNAEIRYGKRVKDKYKKGDKDFVLSCLTHELTHCFISQVSCFHKTTPLRLKAEEQIVEHLSRLLYRLYKQTIKENYAKNAVP